MEPLLCILWQTEGPINHGNRQMHKWYFQSTSTTIDRIWPAWLVHKTSLRVHSPDNAIIQFLPKFDVVIYPLVTGLPQNPHICKMAQPLVDSSELYEGGVWNTGGSCAGADRPATKTVRNGYANAMWKQQVEEFERAAKKLRNGSKLTFMDVTEMSGYRHDWHAGPYQSNVRKKGGPEDCFALVHAWDG